MSVACCITRDPIDPAALLRSVIAPSDGAALLFWGVVRDHNDGRDVRYLEYEAYTAMAQAELTRIATEARDRWDTGQIAVIHRVGRLEIGEASVGIVVASPHREAAFSASRYVIEEIKRRVPIWKREGYVGGPSEWQSGVVPSLVAESLGGRPSGE